MKRSKRIIKYLESSESEDEKPLKKASTSQIKPSEDQESSSESDIENYLLKPEKLDLNSDFFNVNEPEFEKVEKNILADVTKLSSSESEIDEDESKEQTQSQKMKSPLALKANSRSSSEMSFKQLQDYIKKIEGVKKQVETYKAKMELNSKSTDVHNLLVAGEKKYNLEQLGAADLHSSDFESHDSEQEDWEEIKATEKQEKNLVPQKGLEITVDLPEKVRKRKGVDLLAAMKRRLNRIRKENQVLVHKVHLLCWIAHGNYVNQVVNNTEILAVALSLLPSEQCYPADRIDLSYLEKIVGWYKRTMKIVGKPVPDGTSLDKCIQSQISKKEAYDKKMLTFIFVSILRALGVQCRIVMSLQVEPLRPPLSQLHTVSTKESQNTKITSEKNTSSKLKSTSLKPNLLKHNCSKSSSALAGQEPIKVTHSKISKSNSAKIEKHDAEKKRVTKENPVKEYNKVKNSAKPQESRKQLTRKRTKDTGNKDRDSSLENITGTPEKVKKRNVADVNEDSSSKCVDANTVGIKADTRSSRGRKSVASSSDQRSKGETSEKNLQKKTLIDDKVNVPKNKPTASASINRATKNNSRVLRTRAKTSLSQLDGVHDSDCEFESTILQIDGANDNVTHSKNDRQSRTKSSGTRSRQTRTSKKIVESDSESEFEPPRRSAVNKKSLSKSLEKSESSTAKKLDIRNDVVKLIKGRIAQQKQTDKSRLSKKGKREPESESDSDYVPEEVKKKHHDSDDDFVPKIKVKRRVQIPGKSVLSGSDNEPERKHKKGNDVWVEVFLEAEEKWISVDVVYGQVHCVKEIYQRASHPVSYIVAWENNDKLKDVTQRYCPNFNTVTRKQRIDSKWWNDSLKPFMGTLTARDKEEDGDLARQQLDQPLPKAISEYKNHPFYALKRHLLKFESLYPPEPPTLGFIRGEAVYPRTCVYTLHSRDIWLKQAKVVKLGEQPYKIVKARPKYDRLSNKVITDQTLEIFGPWQVQDYEPPTAENGIVPKNAFGNVDLFKSCMLPKGCVHLKLPGLNKIARKMNIDVAAAIVGFDFHGGWSHPVYDGFVACKEYEDQLICAWELEQDELERKEEEKINKRVYGNWKKLIHGLLIREKLKKKYDFGEPSTSTANDKKNKKQNSTVSKKKV